VGDYEGKQDIETYIQKGEIEQQNRKKKKRESSKKKEIAEFDKTKIARSDLKEKAKMKQR